jgi:hypothetical protein
VQRKTPTRIERPYARVIAFSGPLPTGHAPCVQAVVRPFALSVAVCSGLNVWHDAYVPRTSCDATSHWMFPLGEWNHAMWTAARRATSATRQAYGKRAYATTATP